TDAPFQLRRTGAIVCFRHGKSTGRMRDVIVADGNVGNRRIRVARSSPLAERGEKNGSTVLRKARPGMFEHVTLDQQTLRIFKLKQIFHHERTAAWSIKLYALRGISIDCANE